MYCCSCLSFLSGGKHMNISHVLAVHGNSVPVPHVTFVFCFIQRFARSSLVVSFMEIQMSLRTFVQDKRATRPSFAESRGWTYILTDPINPPLFKIRTLRSKKLVILQLHYDEWGDITCLLCSRIWFDLLLHFYVAYLVIFAAACILTNSSSLS